MINKNKTFITEKNYINDNKLGVNQFSLVNTQTKYLSLSVV